MAKAVNYTPEQTAWIVDRYMEVRESSEEVREALVKELAAELNKKPASVIAKLSREGVYVAKVVVAKDGKPAIKKDKLAVVLADISGTVLTSAENMTKRDMQALVEAFEARDAKIAELEDELYGSDLEEGELPDEG